MNTASKDVVSTQQNLPTIEPARPTTPMDLMQAAIQTGVDADQLGKLMDLQERYEAGRAARAFSAALAGFQAVCPIIHKNRQADRYVYATFDEIMRTIKPHLATAGLSVRFSTEMTGEGVITAICTVSHRDGHSEISQFAAPVDTQMRVNNTQKMGSANSYAKRYALLNALNLSTSEQEDDDGAAAGTITITDDQVAQLNEQFKSLKIKQSKFLEILGTDKIENVPAAKWDQAQRMVDAKRSQGKKK